MKSDVIYIRLNEILEKRQKSLYWLSASAGVPYPTLWRLQKKGTQDSISLPILSRICSALNCLPGDVLVYTEDEVDSAIKNLIKSQEKTKKKGKKAKI